MERSQYGKESIWKGVNMDTYEGLKKKCEETTPSEKLGYVNTDSCEANMVKTAQNVISIITKRIHRIYHDCLIGEPFTDETTIIHACGNSVIFSKPELDNHKQEILDLLEFLPESYHSPEGACTFSKTELELCQLGEAIGKLKHSKIMDVSSILPIGMPIYTMIKND